MGKLEEEEKAARIRFGLNMVKSFVAGKEESEVTLIDDSGGLYSLLEKQAEEFSWTMKRFFEMYGGEADRVVVVGTRELEAISRSRLSLAVLLCCRDESDRRGYNEYAPGYRAAIEQGLVEVALPPWHPQISNLRAMLPIPPQPVAGAAGAADAGAGGAVGDGDAGVAGSGGEMERFGEATEFINWGGRGAANLILSEIEENSDDDDDEDDEDSDDNDDDDVDLS